MDIERQLREELKRKAQFMHPSDRLNKRVAASFENHFHRNTKNKLI